GRPHWPLSSMATGTMGWSTAGQEGLQFQCTLTEESTGVRLRPRGGAPVFNDFDLYLMGFLAPEDVEPQLVFADQAAAQTISSQPCAGQLYTGPMTRVTVGDIIANYGERTPRAGVAQTHFRVATIVVTEDRLLDADAMAFFSHFARRMALTSDTPVHSG